jgi:lipopolysaccharide/colanic/teichoic acid biosynthesis glycosyltransferase
MGYPFWKDLLDRISALVGLLLLSPVLLGMAIWIKLDSRGPVFYRQRRVGRGGEVFGLYKFRTMRPASDQAGLLTVGGRDPRVTRAGYWLRKYKLDELPQLWNVVMGDMSIVGPRPEVEKYVALYNEAQRRVLAVKPGLTDLASLEYFDESDLLAQSPDPERTYIDEIMPAKLTLNQKYIEQQSFGMDLSMIFRTLGKIFIQDN